MTNRFQKRLARIVPCLALIALLSSGCMRQSPAGTGAPAAGSPAAPTGDGSVVTITFACHEWQQSEFEQLAAEFHDQNPAIQVTVLSLDDIFGHKDYTDLSRPAFAADTAYFMVNASMGSQWSARDLTPFIQADASFDPGDFFPGMLEAFHWNGATLALPSQAWLHVLFYDKQQFDAAGVAYPTMDWTQADFLAAAQQLTERRGDEVRRYGFVDSGGESQWVWVIRPASRAGEPTLDAPAADAVRWYTDLALRYNVMPPSSIVDDAEDVAFWLPILQAESYLVRYGKAATWYLEYSPGMLYDPERTLGVALLPVDGGTVVQANMYGYTMSAGTQYPQESWLWLRFLTHHLIATAGDGAPLGSRAVRLLALCGRGNAAGDTLCRRTLVLYAVGRRARVPGRCGHRCAHWRAAQ